MSLVTVYDGGTASAMGEQNLALLPKAYPRDGSVRGVIYCHGALSTETQVLGTTFPNTAAIVAAIANIYPTLACRFSGDAWANDAAIAKVALAKTYLQGTVGAKSGKVFLLGGSMGGQLAMAYARANPTLVQALELLLPVCDPQDIVTNNRGSLASSVNAAYSGGYSDATYAATHSPKTFGASLAGIATQAWLATDDAVVIPQTVTDTMALIGGVDLHAVTGGHSDAANANVVIPTVLSFLAAAA